MFVLRLLEERICEGLTAPLQVKFYATSMGASLQQIANLVYDRFDLPSNDAQAMLGRDTPGFSSRSTKANRR